MTRIVLGASPRKNRAHKRRSRCQRCKSFCYLGERQAALLESEEVVEIMCWPCCTDRSWRVGGAVLGELGNPEA